MKLGRGKSRTGCAVLCAVLCGEPACEGRTTGVVLMLVPGCLKGLPGSDVSIHRIRFMYTVETREGNVLIGYPEHIQLVSTNSPRNQSIFSPLTF